MTEETGSSTAASQGSDLLALGSPDCAAQLRGICKSYRKSATAPVVQALCELDLDIPRGQYLGVMGPSGSGKSTLMNVLGCLDRPNSGTYLLAGTNVATLSDEELSQCRGQRIGFVFQGFNLISQLTVLENVQVPLFYQGIHRRDRRALAMEAVERVQLGERANHRPSELSGGQQQRAAIARALVNKPSLLLADEPTGNLDSATGKAILDMFDELHQLGLTIIMVTHDMSVSRRCQRLIWLRDGVVERDEYRQ